MDGRAISTDPASDRIIGEELIHKGRKFDYFEVTLRAADGGELSRQAVRYPGAAVILPILERDGERLIVFERVERFAVGKTLWELPAGTLDPGEDAATCAARELEEETGYRAASIEPIASFHASPGMSDEIIFAFAAIGLEQIGQKLEPDERLTVEPLTPDRAFGMLDSGELTDAKSMVTLLLAARRGLI